jgi:hypothetical protein
MAQNSSGQEQVSKHALPSFFNSKNLPWLIIAIGVVLVLASIIYFAIPEPRDPKDQVVIDPEERQDNTVNVIMAVVFSVGFLAVVGTFITKQIFLD